jgi:hypothetical protein
MRDTIKITLVLKHHKWLCKDKQLVGKTASDRWNLATLLGENHKLYWDRANSAAKKLRRLLKRLYGDAFKVVMDRGTSHVVHAASRKEADSLGPALASVIPADYLDLYT